MVIKTKRIPITGELMGRYSIEKIRQLYGDDTANKVKLINEISFHVPVYNANFPTKAFIICNNEDEIESNVSCWGNATFELSTKDIDALLEGKTLAAMVNDEYGVFIKLEELSNAEN